MCAPGDVKPFVAEHRGAGELREFGVGVEEVDVVLVGEDFIALNHSRNGVTGSRSTGAAAIKRA